MDVQAARADMRQGMAALQSRGLSRSAAWLADCLVGTPPQAAVGGRTVYCGSPTVFHDVSPSDAYLLAKCHFDNREFRRAAHVIDAQYTRTSGAECGDARSFFLRCYSLHLVRA